MNTNKDELITIAKFFAELGSASKATLQTKFSFGFGKSSAILDTLEELGIVGPHNGAKSRDVLVSPDQIDEIFTGYESKTEPTDARSVTIMKYQARDGRYYFIVKDKFDIADEVERLDAMNKLRDEMLATGEMAKFLWTKETVLF